MDWTDIVKYIFMGYYFVVFSTGFVGNLLIIISVYRFKKMRNVVNIFLTNLAIADLLFVLLSLFDAFSYFFNEWKFGNAACRIQSTFIELSYTVSVLTLSVVSIERYTSICKPYTKKRTLKQSVYMLLLIWIFGLCFCGVLLYGYSEKTINGVTLCLNENWSDQYRLMFYIIHSVLVFLVPLFLMCLSHLKISNALVSQQRRLTVNKQCLTTKMDINKNLSISTTSSEKEFKTKSTRRQQKAKGRMNVIRLLMVVTLIFFMLWSPFIVIRLCKYNNMHIHETLWKGSQLLMFGTTAVNVIIYAFMSPPFRTAFRTIICCRKSPRNAWNGFADSSRSFDLSETIRIRTPIKDTILIHEE